MNKQQVIDKLHSSLSDKGTVYPRWELIEIVESFLEVVSDSLEQGHNVSLTNFGKFSVKTKRSRQFYNIQKGKTEQTPERTVIEFNPRKKNISSKPQI